MWMAESVSADHNKNSARGAERDGSMKRVTQIPVLQSHPGSYKETDCLMGVLATSIEDRDTVT